MVLACVAFSSLIAADAGSAKKLTAQARAAVMQAFPQGQIASVSKERAGGLTLFEVDVVSGADRMEIEVTPAGEIVEIENEVTVAQLPSALQSKLVEALDGAQIKNVERVAIQGQVVEGRFVKSASELVVFEVEYRHRGRRHEAVFDSDGQRLADEEDDDDDEDEDDDDDDDESVT